MVGVRWWQKNEPDNSKGGGGDGEDSGVVGDRRRSATMG